MRAYVIDSYLKDVTKELPGRLQESAPEPAPKSNEVIVEVHAAALNFFDGLQLQGRYQTQPPFPWVPGTEFAGVIAQNSPIPKGCPFEKGDRVFGASQGAYGERVASDWRTLIEIPENLSFEQASGLSITYPTSYLALVIRAQLKPEDVLLVHAAAGGVGLAACQIAKAIGATVIATAGSEEKLRVCKEVGGADHAILYNDEKTWQAEVKKLTGGKGVDVVYDPIGLIKASLKVVNWNARILVIGFAAGEIEKIPTNLLLLKHASLVGVFWGGMTKREPDLIPEVWGGLLEMLGEGKLKPAVFSTKYRGLEALPQGLDDLNSRRTWGKAVLSIKDSKSSRL